MKFRISVFVLIIALIFCVLLSAELWIYLLLFIIFGFITFLGVVNMDFNWFMKNITGNPKISEKNIALTFDDGPTEFTSGFLEL